eukprot:3592238-Pleurochrysis_carterae.AAC.2
MSTGDGQRVLVAHPGHQDACSKVQLRYRGTEARHLPGSSKRDDRRRCGGDVRYIVTVLESCKDLVGRMICAQSSGWLASTVYVA